MSRLFAHPCTLRWLFQNEKIFFFVSPSFLSFTGFHRVLLGTCCVQGKCREYHYSSSMVLPVPAPKPPATADCQGTRWWAWDLQPSCLITTDVTVNSNSRLRSCYSISNPPHSRKPITVEFSYRADWTGYVFKKPRLALWQDAVLWPLRPSFPPLPQVACISVSIETMETIHGGNSYVVILVLIVNSVPFKRYFDTERVRQENLLWFNVSMSQLFRTSVFIYNWLDYRCQKSTGPYQVIPKLIFLLCDTEIIWQTLLFALPSPICTLSPHEYPTQIYFPAFPVTKYGQKIHFSPVKCEEKWDGHLLLKRYQLQTCYSFFLRIWLKINGNGWDNLGNHM